MQALWAALQGKKTYIIAAIGILGLWAQVWQGTLDQSTAIDGTFGFLGLGAVRHGVSTTKGP